jgi:hypothetical protein
MKMFEKCESDYKRAHSPSTYYGSGHHYAYKDGRWVTLDNSTKKALTKATKVLNNLK